MSPRSTGDASAPVLTVNVLDGLVAKAVTLVVAPLIAALVVPLRTLVTIDTPTPAVLP